MEYLLEIIIIAQCAVTLWLSHTVGYLNKDLENVINSHNKLATAFVEILLAIDSKVEHND